MNSILMALYIALLFFVLAPGILLTIPRGGSKTMVAMTHALVAAAVFYFTHKMAYNFLRRFEGFQKMGVDASAKMLGAEKGTARASTAAPRAPRNATNMVMGG